MKQQHKSKEQIVYEKEQKKLAETRKAFIDKTFMPLMAGITETVEEAQFLCETLKTVINQAWQQKAGEWPLSDLKMLEHLENVKRPELVWKHKKIVEALQGQTIQDSMILLDALFDEAHRAIAKSITSQKLKDFMPKDDRPTVKSNVEQSTATRP